MCWRMPCVSIRQAADQLCKRQSRKYERHFPACQTIRRHGHCAHHRGRRHPQYCTRTRRDCPTYCQGSQNWGISPKDLIFDPLAMAVSSDANSAEITLQTVRMLHEMGYRVSLGVSNISFGLPQRDKINAAFFTAPHWKQDWTAPL